MNFIIPKIAQMNIRRDGFNVVVEIDGRKVADVPWNIALELGRGITMQARRVEEVVKAEEIIADQALLIRTGIPIGLSSNPDIVKASGNEAVHNPTLRKYIPDTSGIGAINSRGIVGRPRVIKHKGPVTLEE